MSYNIKTVPNQKVVKVEKEACNKQNLYAAINLEAMNNAALDLEAGAFKLWVYFAKNQNNYEFALSRKEVEVTFGIKKKQYDNAVNQLIEKGYLVEKNGNRYIFYEVPRLKEDEEENKNSVVSKGNHDVVSKGNHDVVSKSNHAWYPKDTRNNTDNTKDNTINNTDEGFKISDEILNTSKEQSEVKKILAVSPSNSKEGFVF